MGGYARFVWPSIGFALSVLVWNVWSALRHQARTLVRVRRALQMARSEES
ncbi:MAG: heme exporter protein CcmD [Steroidobacteraceae bacterium]|nr:heme exporter protein CcmD [Steroidobacteraceae bacterium]